MMQRRQARQQAEVQRRAEDDRRYFHDVGPASRLRIHNELAAEHEHCPLCGTRIRFT
ncbi:MAG TPA: hypothetical protein VEW95_05480 [Candidatus Limnocylindrales bacterium]|nr:hypothetical protein [Candidatus Limnocylindrales bacterium]